MLVHGQSVGPRRQARFHLKPLLRSSWPAVVPDIIRLNSVEVLSNLAWVAIAVFLWGFWLADRRRAHDGALLPRTGAQLIALAMLTAILLPVISVTDDLQASHNPAEVERACSRTDQHAFLYSGMHPAPAAHALLATDSRFARPRTIGFRTSEHSPRCSWRAHIPVFWSRPPPVSPAVSVQA